MDIDVEYQTACAEVLEIINNIPYIDYLKIPTKKIQVFEKYANKDLSFKYDSDLSLNDQNISETAKTIIALLYRDYWATPEQRKEILEIENIERNKLEEEKKKKYNPEEIFKDRQKIIKTEKISLKSEEIIEYKESILKRILNKIKSIFL